MLLCFELGLFVGGVAVCVVYCGLVVVGCFLFCYASFIISLFFVLYIYCVCELLLLFFTNGIEHMLAHGQ